MIETLLNFSGGIDSTYVLYQWLRNNPTKKILVHHIHIRNIEKRYEKEAIAVENILQWLRDHGLDNFEYIESTFDYEQAKGLCLDGMIVTLFTSLITQGYPNLKETFLCTPLDEKLRLGNQLIGRRNKYQILREAISVGHQLKTTEVVIHLFKKEIIQGLPRDLFELTWYCRKPMPNGDTCKECHTCQQVAVSF